MFGFARRAVAIDQVKDEAIVSSASVGELMKNMVHRHTPDVVDLERRIKQFVFVPNEWMKRHPQHEQLGGAMMIGTVFTQDRFSVWRRKMGEASSVIPIRQGFTSVPKATIKGELYLVPTQKLFQLDKDQGNGLYFKRERIKVNLPFTKTELVHGPSGYYEDFHRGLIAGLNAWMYIGVSGYWNRLLDAGYSYKPVNLFKPNNPLLEHYYYHTIEDYDKST